MSASFLQTKEWADFQQSLGRKTFFLSGDGWRALLIRHNLPIGRNYLYCPRGPVTAHSAEFPISPSTSSGFRAESRDNFQFPNNRGDDIIKEFLEKVAGVARQENSIFFRWDQPFTENFSAEGGSASGGQFSIFNFQKTLHPTPYTLYPTHSVQPQHTLLIDLTKSEEDLLAAMHEKTRYNIRLAQRKGVAMREANGSAALDTFWKLLQQTSVRDVFSTHSREHYEKLVQVFNPPLRLRGGEGELEFHNSSQPPLNLRGGEETPFVRLYLAEHNNTPLAAAIVMFYDGVATYLHGASANTHRDVMAPHLLHWRIMQDAKKLEYHTYDLWGIDPSTGSKSSPQASSGQATSTQLPSTALGTGGAGDKNPRWAGITRFKRGFGGKEFSYVSSLDIAFKTWWYQLYRLTRLRHLLR